MRRICRSCRLALTVTAVLAILTAVPSTPDATTALAGAPAAPARTAHDGATRAPLDALRWSAAQGDADASVELAARLLDAYERGGPRDDLHEAMQWLVRDWQEPSVLRSPVLQRVVHRHCQDNVLQWHWLCTQGE
jgi:hypothetical protein